MLATLRIKNLALVADLTLELAPGLNVITGETGAGKSIILGALNLVLGQRADRTLIRSGADSCSVEAVFEFGDTVRGVPSPEALAALGLEPCEAGQLILKRTFTAAGTNRQFVNGSPTSLSTLAALGDGLVDLHGPHDHQSLLQPARQLAILDAFGSLGEARKEFAARIRQRDAIDEARAAWVVDEQTVAQQLDLLRFQIQEIEAARLREDEEAELEADHQRAVHASRLLELTQSALGLLSEEDDAALGRLGGVGRLLHEMQRFDTTLADAVQLQDQAMTNLRELQSTLSRYLDALEVDPGRLGELEARLNLLQTLKRKYGRTVSDILAFARSARERLSLLEGREAEAVRLEAARTALTAEIEAAGKDLTAARRQHIPKLARAVARELAALGFRQSQFDVVLSPLTQPTTTGFDACEFQFTPNPGEPARPLRAIASSGELARVMLALKTVLADEDEVPVLVFDEVDANLGGEAATAVGLKLRQIARQHQVLCITHLAPVAAAGQSHYLVSKELRQGRTETHVSPLDAPGRIGELTRMLGANSEAARRHAEELLAYHAG